jgi:hypothetical protein
MKLFRIRVCSLSSPSNMKIELGSEWSSREVNLGGAVRVNTTHPHTLTVACESQQ